MKRRILTVAYSVGAVALIVGFLTAAKEVADKGAPAPAPEPARPSNGKKMVLIGYADNLDAIVRIYPDNFPQPCKVTKVLIAEGDTVRAGQPLLELDDRYVQLKIAEAVTGVEAAKQEKVKAEAAVKGQEPQVNAANNELSSKTEELNAKKVTLEEEKRAAGLMNMTAAIKAALDTAEANVKAAEFMLEASRWKVKGLKDHNPKYLVDLAEAGVKAAENKLDQAKYAAEQYFCKAPADGRIIRSFASEGMMFGPATREPAFWFIKNTPLILRCEVNQEFARRVAKGTAGRIEDDADPTLAWKGKVVRISDQYLAKRAGGGNGAVLFQASDDRILECIVSIDLGPNDTPPRYGQKLRVTLGE